MTCINCGAEATGKYCSECGQRMEVKRLTLKEAWFDFGARIYGFDGMFPRTFRDLTLRAGATARVFIAGNRARYYGPVGYFFFMITCFLLVLSIVGLPFSDYLQSMQEGIPVEQEPNPFADSVRSFVSDNMKLVAFLYIPFQAFVARYIFLRKQGLNFLEHAVLPLYATGHWYWVTMVEAIVFKFTHYSVGTPIQTLLIAAYIGYSYTTFTSDQSKTKLFFKGVGIYFLSFLLVMIIAMLVGVVLVIWAMKYNPELIKQIRPTKG